MDNISITAFIVHLTNFAVQALEIHEGWSEDDACKVLFKLDEWPEDLDSAFDVVYNRNNKIISSSTTCSSNNSSIII